MTWILRDTDQTVAFGVALGEMLSPGDVVILTGPLGAGKTTVTKGIARGLGVADAITSPTFVIAHIHNGARMQLVHVDAYRLGSQVEFDDLDLDADLDASAIVVEWGEGRAEGLSDQPLHVLIEPDESDESRRVTLSGEGDHWANVVACLTRWSA